MNTIRKSIIIGMTVLGLGGTTLAVQAQQADAAAQPGARSEKMHAKWGERVAARQQKLHAALKLTPAQEPAWTAYTGAIKPAAWPEHGQRGEMKSLPAPERLQKRLEMAKQHVATMETQLAATTTFYTSLTPEQKKLFDDNSMHHDGHHMRHGMRG